jgi:hypothetical protein
MVPENINDVDTRKWIALIGKESSMRTPEFDQPTIKKSGRSFLSLHSQIQEPQILHTMTPYKVYDKSSFLE